MEHTRTGVLLVEDDTSIRELVATMLREDGHACETAVDGIDAWTRLRAGLRPALVVADVHMPKLGGRDLASRMLADAELCAIPVVFTSGSDAAGDRTVNWLLKPYRIEALLEYVTKYCGGVGSTVKHPVRTHDGQTHDVAR